MHRRAFIRGAALGAGASFLGPIALRLVSEARGNPLVEPKLLIFTTYSGFEHATPTRIRSESDYDLHPGMSPHESMKSRMLIIRSFVNPHETDLHGNVDTLLTIRDKSGPGDEDAMRPGGMSFDRYMARAWGSTSRFSSLYIRGGGEGGGISADGVGQPYPYDREPLATYERLFGNVGGGSGTGDDAGARARAELRLRQRRSVLDRIVDDLQTLDRRLAAPERAKLEQYTESLRELERRLATSSTAPTPAPVRCGSPQRPPALAAEKHPDRNPERYVQLADIAGLALACDLTRVLVLSTELEFYGFLGASHSIHQLWHGRGNASSHLPLVARWNIERFTQVISRLEALPFMNGTLADTLVAVHLNTGGGEHHHGHRRHPAVVIAPSSGPFRVGRYLDVSNRNYGLGDFLATLATGLGVPTPRFGDERSSRGLVEEMLA